MSGPSEQERAASTMANLAPPSKIPATAGADDQKATPARRTSSDSNSAPSVLSDSHIPRANSVESASSQKSLKSPARWLPRLNLFKKGASSGGHLESPIEEVPRKRSTGDGVGVNSTYNTVFQRPGDSSVTPQTPQRTDVPSSFHGSASIPNPIYEDGQGPGNQAPGGSKMSSFDAMSTANTHYSPTRSHFSPTRSTSRFFSRSELAPVGSPNEPLLSDMGGSFLSNLATAQNPAYQEEGEDPDSARVSGLLVDISTMSEGRVPMLNPMYDKAGSKRGASARKVEVPPNGDAFLMPGTSAAFSDLDMPPSPTTEALMAPQTLSKIAENHVFGETWHSADGSEARKHSGPAGNDGAAVRKDSGAVSLSSLGSPSVLRERLANVQTAAAAGDNTTFMDSVGSGPSAPIPIPAAEAISQDGATTPDEGVPGLSPSGTPNFDPLDSSMSLSTTSSMMQSGLSKSLTDFYSMASFDKPTFTGKWDSPRAHRRGNEARVVSNAKAMAGEKSRAQRPLQFSADPALPTDREGLENDLSLSPVDSARRSQGNRADGSRGNSTFQQGVVDNMLLSYGSSKASRMESLSRLESVSKMSSRMSAGAVPLPAATANEAIDEGDLDSLSSIGSNMDILGTLRSQQRDSPRSSDAGVDIEQVWTTRHNEMVAPQSQQHAPKSAVPKLDFTSLARNPQAGEVEASPSEEEVSYMSLSQGNSQALTSQGNSQALQGEEREVAGHLYGKLLQLENELARQSREEHLLRGREWEQTPPEDIDTFSTVMTEGASTQLPDVVIELPLPEAVPSAALPNAPLPNAALASLSVSAPLLPGGAFNTETLSNVSIANSREIGDAWGMGRDRPQSPQDSELILQQHLSLLEANQKVEDLKRQLQNKDILTAQLHDALARAENDNLQLRGGVPAPPPEPSDFATIAASLLMASYGVVEMAQVLDYKLQPSMKTVCSTVEASKQENERLRAEHTAATTALEASTQRVAALEQELTKNAAAMTQLRQELDTAHGSLSSKQAEVATLQDKLAKEATTFGAERAEQASSLEALTKQVDSLKDELFNAQSSYNACAVIALRQDTAKLQTDLRQTKKALAAAKEEATTYQQKLAANSEAERTWRDDMTSMKREHVRNIENLQKSEREIAELKEEVAKLHEERAKVDGAFEQSRREVSQLRMGLATTEESLRESSQAARDLEEELKEVKKALAAARSDASKVEAERSQHIEALSDSTTQLNHFKAELARHVKMLEASKRKAASFEGEVAARATEVATLNEAVARLQAELQGLKQVQLQRDEAVADLEAMRGEHSRSAEALVASERERWSLSERVAVLTKENQALSEMADIAKAALAANAADSARLLGGERSVAALAATPAEVARMQTDLDRSLAAVTALNQEVVRLQTTHAAAISQLQAELLQRTTALAQSAGNVSELKRQLDVKTDELAAAQADIADLRGDVAALRSGAAPSGTAARAVAMHEPLAANFYPEGSLLAAELPSMMGSGFGDPAEGIENALRQIVRLEGELSSATTELNTLRRENAALKQEQAVDKPALASSKSELSIMHAELVEVTAELDATRRELAKLDEERAAEKKEFEAATAEFAASKDEVSAARAELEKVAAELEAARAEVAKLSEERTADKSALASSKAELSAVHAELLEATEALAAAQSASEAQKSLVSKQLSNARHETHDMMAESSDSMRELERLQAALRESQMREALLASQVDGDKLEAAVLQHPEYVKLVSENEALRAQVESLTKDMEMLQMDAGYMTISAPLQLDAYMSMSAPLGAVLEGPEDVEVRGAGASSPRPQEYSGFHPPTPDRSRGTMEAPRSETSNSGNIGELPADTLRERFGPKAPANAEALAERDRMIKTLNSEVKQLREQLAAQPGACPSAPLSRSGTGTQNEWAEGAGAGPSEMNPETLSMMCDIWDGVPPPETLAQALQQIVLLHDETRRLKEKLRNTENSLQAAEAVGVAEAAVTRLQKLAEEKKALEEEVQELGSELDYALADEAEKIEHYRNKYKEAKALNLELRTALQEAHLRVQRMSVESHVAPPPPTSISTPKPTPVVHLAMDGTRTTEESEANETVLLDLSKKVVEWQSRFQETEAALIQANLNRAEMTTELERLKLTVKTLMAQLEGQYNAAIAAPEPVKPVSPTAKNIFTRSLFTVRR